ncbi:hypothetical protein Q3O59_14335 [Alkalimonas delamerensis]|uniref:DUF58 domain-containing protein n=1 Tax=Alkalimonas delamerensis TaxID=265981 RepID=A0ABT9GTA1_9GAMM|nr:hypothetical protein [Alkalimonas delamerensis]MDP4530204.1 hypothetical protein [Alkalimonas delamerensis]
MLWPYIKNSRTIQSLLFLSILLLLFWQGYYVLLLMALLAVMEGLAVFYGLRNTTKWTDIRDVQALLAIDKDGKLRVGMEQAASPETVKVLLKHDKKYGYLQVTLNYHGPLRYRFPLQQLEPLQQWLSTELPDLQLEHQLRN